MTDDQEHLRPRRGTSPGDEAAFADDLSAGRGDDLAAPDDPMTALEHLQSLTARTAVVDPGQPATVVQGHMPEPVGHRARSRPHVAAGAGSGRVVARVAAPAVFLIAVIALVSFVARSGMLSGSKPTVSPTPKVTKTTVSHAGTTFYKVKAGDSLSGIAVTFKTTTSQILKLNPTLSSTTLVIGQKIRVPKVAK